MQETHKQILGAIAKQNKNKINGPTLRRAVPANKKLL